MDNTEFDVLKYNANEGRENRIREYKSVLGLEEDFEITEENLDDYGVRYISCHYNCPKERVRSELLGKPWSEYEGE